MTLSSAARQTSRSLSIPAMLLVVALIAIAVVRVAATRNVFSGTSDEPAHVASGYDWWRGELTTDPTHPPLAKLLMAVPLVQRGVPAVHVPDFVQRGNGLLDYKGRYQANLAAVRWANLLFLAIGAIAIALWTAQLFGASAAAWATLIYTLLPPILAHSGLATTDMAVAAMFGVAVLALERWLDDATLSRSIALGLALGLGMLSKFSFVPFFGLALIVAVIMYRRPHGERWFRHLLVAAGVALLVVWAGYRFTFGTMIKADSTAEAVLRTLPPEPLRATAMWIGSRVPLPAPSFLVGLGRVALHDRDGHFAFLLGECRQKGWWYYFPVAFFYKTPLAVLILSALGLLYAMGSRSFGALRLFVYALAVLAFAMTSSINIGIRHVLPMYIPLSALAGFAIARAWTEGFAARLAVLGFTGWLVIAGVVAHPDYLAYFNEAAGEHPDRILVDSNLDWGQDMYRLAEFQRERNIDHMGALITFTARLERLGIRASWLPPNERRKGWIAVSPTAFALENCRTNGYDWLRPYRPVAHVGKSIDMYYIP